MGRVGFGATTPINAGSGFIGIPKTLIVPFKRIKPASAFRHSARILTIFAKASFWALCFHYFGTKALLYAVASWTFLLGVKDITFVRVRLSSLRDPAKSRMAYAKSVAAEILLIAVRIAAIFALAFVVAPFNQVVAAVIPIMAVCAGLWARETFIATAAVYGTGSWRVFVSLVAAATGLGSIIYFAENGFDPIKSAIWAILVREGISFFGFAAVALLGCFGMRSKSKMEDIDDEDGGEVAQVVTPDGREVRSAWKLLIADNVIYSKWRMMHFATRFVANGILGPFGGIATRIAFTYRKPKPYKHHSKRVSIAKVAGIGVVAAITVSAVIYFGEKWGLLHAIGIVAAAFLFRVIALSLNLLFWRQLSPIVGAPGRLRPVNAEFLQEHLSDPFMADQGGSPRPPSKRMDGAE